MAEKQTSPTGAGAADGESSSSADLERLFQEHHARVFAAAYRITGNGQDAEDVLQTVFLRLANRRQELGLSPHPASYLHRAAVNGALDLLRARARARSVPLDDVAHQAVGDARDNPVRQTQSREMRRRLREAITTLSPKSAEIFSLRYLEDLPNKEIAAMVGKSQTAVAVALFRARSQIRNEMQSFVGGF